MNFFKYFIKNEVDPSTIKYFLLAYGIKKRQLRITERRTRNVNVSDIIGGSEKWAKTIKLYQDGIRAIEKGKAPRTTELYKHEYANAHQSHKHIAILRITNFLNLYNRIKSEGYRTTIKDMIRIMDIEGMPEPIEKFITTRFSDKYYRLTGMKRCIICDFLGIKTIQCRVLKIKVVQI